MRLRADTTLIGMQFLTLTGIVVAQALGQSGMTSRLFTLTFFLTAALWATVAERKIGKIGVLSILIVILSCINVLINTVCTSTVLSFSYLKKIIMFWTTILFFATMCEYKPEKSVAQLVLRMNTLTALCLIGLYVFRREEMHILNGRITGYLTFQFSNPNLTAVFLLSICMIEMICVYASKGWLRKGFHAGVAGILTFFIVMTRSRTALLLLVGFLTVFVWTLFSKRSWKIQGWVALLIAVLPLLIAVVYMLVVNSEWFSTLFAFLAEEDKPLDSRLDIWEYAFGLFRESPLIGAYSQVLSGELHVQMHNTHVDILTSYGIPVMILVIYFLYLVFQMASVQMGGRINQICAAAFATILLTGVGEAMLFSGGIGIYISAGVILMIANYDFDAEKNEMAETV